MSALINAVHVALHKCKNTLAKHLNRSLCSTEYWHFFAFFCLWSCFISTKGTTEIWSMLREKTPTVHNPQHGHRALSNRIRFSFSFSCMTPWPQPAVQAYRTICMFLIHGALFPGVLISFIHWLTFSLIKLLSLWAHKSTLVNSARREHSGWFSGIRFLVWGGVLFFGFFCLWQQRKIPDILVLINKSWIASVVFTWLKWFRWQLYILNHFHMRNRHFLLLLLLMFPHAHE